MTTLAFDPKRTTEDVKLSVDFKKWLASGEAIQSASVTATVHKGTDGSPGAIVSGAAVISGSKVTQKIIDGVDGVTYCLTFQATTDQGQVLEALAHITVDDSC